MKEKRPVGRPPKTERNVAIVFLRDERGLSFKKIAEQLGIKRQTVHEIYWQTKRQGNYPQGAI